MVRIIAIAILFISSISFGQKTIVETGRPKPFIHLNAQEVVGKKYKIEYKYVPFRNSPQQLDSIREINEATYAFLAKKYGENWESELAKAIETTLQKFTSYTEILIQKEYATEENLIYFKKIPCSKNFKAEIYPNISPEERQKGNLIRKVKMRKFL